MNKDAYDLFMRNWRGSEYYTFVMEIIQSELNKSYVKDEMMERIAKNEPMDDLEIARAMRVEASANLRIQSIKEALS